MIKVTWTIICDLCGKKAGYTEEASIWDEYFDVPHGWDIHFHVPEEYRTIPTDDVCEVCSECQQNPRWENYKKCDPPLECAMVWPFPPSGLDA